MHTWAIPTMFGGCAGVGARWLGALPMLAALAVWAVSPRPAVLISEDGALAGVMTPEGRAMSKPRGGGFAARSWLENDGDPATQAEAHGRKQAASGGAGRIELGDAVLWHVAGRGAADALAGACAAADIVFAALDRPDVPTGCRVYDRAALRATGALALYPGPEGPVIVTARSVTGQRPWNLGQ